MRIFYDGLIYDLYHQRTGGISRYFDALISHLPVNTQILLTSSRPQHLSHPAHPNLRIAHVNQYRWPSSLWRKVANTRYHAEAKLFQPNIIHPTYYRVPSMVANKTSKPPLIYTVYDMIHEIFHEKEDPSGQAAAAKKQCVDRADLLLCISEATRNDLLSYYPYLEDRSVVVHLGCSTTYSDRLDFPGDQPIPQFPLHLANSPYILYVGARHHYKNFWLLAKAFAHIKSAYPDLYICIAGSRLNEEEWRRAAELGITDRIVQVDSPNDQLLQSLYHAATLFVYPSLYEGFGLPPLEAMQCGTPVVASNTSSIPEVVGDAALLIDPQSLDELIGSIEALLESPALRQRYRRLGFQQAKLFSWDVTANQTYGHYRSLL